MNLMNPFMNRLGLDIIPRGLPPMDLASSLYAFASMCPDIKRLDKSYDEGIPNKDLMDQYQELCTHPTEGAREISCSYYKNFEKIRNLYLDGAEEILKNWSSKGELK